MAQRPGLAVKIAVRKPKPGPDLGSPSDFGRPGSRSLPSSALPTRNDVHGDGNDDSLATAAATVSPEALHYHDEAQRCELCEHFGQDGQCAVLQMTVQPEGGCNAFSGRDTDEDSTEPDYDDLGGDADMPPARGSGHPQYGG
ncbi:MAG: hypothetical protein JO108_20705 [Acidobacteriaceae bacterium]|nr:hypothetical protein [Acidobacteriaceae bacterium]